MRSKGQELARFIGKGIMKKLLTFSILIATAIAVSAEPKGLSVPAGKKHVKVEKPAPITRSEVRGVIPRAVRGGNPLQMLNPKAPAKYGTAEQSVAYNPFTGKYDQIKLVEIVF
jgi:hypothetical protein